MAPLTLDRVIDEAPLGVRRGALLVIGLMLMIMEGYDTYAVGFVAPRLTTLWHVPPSGLGLVLTSGIIGSAIAYILIGPLADRHGRRRLVILPTFCLSGASLLTMTAAGQASFTGWRVLTGLALGAALPNIIALCAEYAPARIRSLAVVILYSGFGIGAALGGIVAGKVVPAFGWQAVFALGGAVPLLLALTMLAVLPESVRFLASRGLIREAGAMLRQVLPACHDDLAIDPPARTVRSPAVSLFAREHRRGTLGIWIALGLNGGITAVLSFWLPSLFARMGVATPLAQAFSVWMLIGGVAGAYLAGFLIDRIGSMVVLISFQTVACGALVLTALTLATPSPVLGFALGASLIGGTTATQSVLAQLYPTAMRATGIGWGNSIGRVTGIGAPLVVGLLAEWGLTPPTMILICLAPALGTMVGLWLIGSTPQRLRR